MLMIIILAVSWMVARVTEKKVEKKFFKYIHKAFSAVKSIFKWNLFIMILTSNLDGVVLYSSFQFRTAYFDSATSIGSLVLCIFVNIVTVFLIVKVVQVVINLQRDKIKLYSLKYSGVIRGKTEAELADKYEEEIKVKYQDYKFIFKEYTHNGFKQQGFLLISILRICLFYCIIAYLFDYPLLQAILINAIGAIMIAYLVFYRPYKKIYQVIKLLMNEGIVLFVNICILLLAIWDRNDMQDQGKKDLVGDCIIQANVVFIIVTLGFMIVDVLLVCFRAYKVYRILKARGAFTWSSFIENVIDDERDLNRIRPTSDMDKEKAKDKYVEKLERVEIGKLYKSSSDGELEPMPKDIKSSVDSDIALSKSTNRSPIKPQEERTDSAATLLRKRLAKRNQRKLTPPIIPNLTSLILRPEN